MAHFWQTYAWAHSQQRHPMNRARCDAIFTTFPTVAVTICAHSLRQFSKDSGRDEMNSLSRGVVEGVAQHQSSWFSFPPHLPLQTQRSAVQTFVAFYIFCPTVPATCLIPEDVKPRCFIFYLFRRGMSLLCFRLVAKSIHYSRHKRDQPDCKKHATLTWTIHRNNYCSLLSFKYWYCFAKSSAISFSFDASIPNEMFLLHRDWPK